MQKWQILTAQGITIGLYEAITASGAVFKLREQRKELDERWNKYWLIDFINGNKITLK